MWQKDDSKYCKTCDGHQNENKSTGKLLGNMMKIQEPSRPWEIVHMDWVMGLPPGGDGSYNAFLVNVDRFSKNPIFFPCHKYHTAMDTAILKWTIVVSWTGIFKTSLLIEVPNSPRNYGQILTNYLRPNYPSLQLTTHQLMA
ncbi:hypothetical protein O181_002243 [Austropuccinia psidii MF-1]|uniref:Uncharacterized protein n=1 Tax=Austropuccinia psidii MF-1 TaxID=1389203 RepID=A0A9Q3BC38_9BASI|nr:hypothetical protein [Austropuccinia psidii MF-1]